MSNSFVANLNLNTQDVEEGQLPNYAPPNTNNLHFQLPYPYTTRPPHPNNSQAQQIAPLPLMQQISHHLTHPDIEFQTVKYNHYHMQNGYSPQSKKKSQKSSHKSSRHHHNNNERDREKDNEKNRYDRKQKDKEVYAIEKSNYPKNDNYPTDTHNRPSTYTPPPYYPPYMYPPMPIMPHHMPPPPIFPYGMPPPPYMHPNSYPYTPLSMMPPHLLNYENSKKGQQYKHSQPIFQKSNQMYRGMPNERMMRDESLVEKSVQNNYKMFGMGGGYMYPYPPPPMPYPPYSAAPYMMYQNPQSYEEGREALEKEQQTKLSHKNQYIDNQKQKIRKSLKHLPNQQKIQILQTLRNIVKFHNPNSESNKNYTDDYSYSTDVDLFRKKTEAHCLERSLLKVEEWMRHQDDKISETVSQLLSYFELNNIKNKIKELKAVRAIDQQKGWSQSRRLLCRLIKFPQQKIL